MSDPTTNAGSAAPAGRGMQRENTLDKAAASMAVSPDPKKKQNGAKRADGVQAADKRAAPAAPDPVREARAPRDAAQQEPDILSDDDLFGSDAEKQEVAHEVKEDADEALRQDGTTEEGEGDLSSLLDADESPDDEGGDDTGDTRALADDTLVAVTVDGEKQEVTLAELKKRYAGEGAIEKRLQEATMSRKAAVETFENARTLIQATIQGFGQELFRPSMEAPDPALRNTNPTEYLLQKTAYDEHIAGLQGRSQKLAQMIAEVNKTNEETRRQAKVQAGASLRKALPILTHEAKGPKVKAAILDAGRHVGYTDAEIAEAADHRPFMLAYYAAKWFALEARQKAGRTPAVAGKTIPAAGGNKSKGSSFSKAQKSAVAKASKTGKVDDVAATMLVKAPRNR